MAVTIPLPNRQRWWRQSATYFEGPWEITNRISEYEFTGDIGTWLINHGHTAKFEDGLLGGFVIHFEDPQVATLFKLTWL